MYFFSIWLLFLTCEGDTQMSKENTNQGYSCRLEGSQWMTWILTEVQSSRACSQWYITSRMWDVIELKQKLEQQREAVQICVKQCSCPFVTLTRMLRWGPCGGPSVLLSTWSRGAEIAICSKSKLWTCTEPAHSRKSTFVYVHLCVFVLVPYVIV